MRELSGKNANKGERSNNHKNILDVIKVRPRGGRSEPFAFFKRRNPTEGDGTYIPPFHVTWYVFYEKVIAYGALEFMPFPLLNSLTRTFN